ncbi:MAG TPA: Gfo/Idh/MocA family oxidoreductase [Roseiflexaceae bacterium]|jgi:predicted dehydrogenase|nr:Gfo/Idh/MocA family oxidoreductase [Roseiflexaceae bacterium]
MIQIGVIGCGDVAVKSYFPGLASMHDRYQVAACFDVQAARAEHAAALFPNARAYTQYDAFLQHPDLDVVLNLTPAPLHYDISAAALRAGLHVYSEKPLAASLPDAQALIDLAQQQERLLLCAPAMMVTPRFRWLKEMLGSQRLGRPTLATAQIAGMGPAAWRAYTGDPSVFYSQSVGPLIDTGVYLLHAITGLLGPAQRVQAFGGVSIPQRQVLIPDRFGETVDVATNDHMLLHLDFGDNTFAQVLSSFAVPRSKTPVMEIHCTAGTISISQAAWYRANGPVDVYLRDESISGLEGWMENVQLPAPGPISDILHAGLAHLANCLEGLEPPMLTAAHALHVLEVMLGAQTSAREGRAIELETRF